MTARFSIRADARILDVVTIEPSAASSRRPSHLHGELRGEVDVGQAETPMPPKIELAPRVSQ